VKEFVHTFIPRVSEDTADLRLLLQWNCVDSNIFRVETMPPSNLAAEHPGIPLALLPFTFDSLQPLTPDHVHSSLRAKAAGFLHRFWEAVGILRDEGYEAKMALTLAQCIPFIQAAKAFVMEYIRCTTTDMQESKRILQLTLPLSYENYQEACPSGTQIFMRMKAYYFGIHGFSPAEVVGGRLVLRKILF